MVKILLPYTLSMTSPAPTPDDSTIGFDLESTPTAPVLPGEVVMRPAREDVFDALAADLLIHAHNCVRTFGDVHLALSGGSTPLPFYQHLMIDPRYRDFPWRRTHIWLVDERRVPIDDDRSNTKNIAAYLDPAHSDIPKNNFHVFDWCADGIEARYTHDLQHTLAWREKGQDRIDFALLGLGGDGHTASLFPNSPALAERERPICINAGPSVTPPDRVTMTFPLLNSARLIAFLALGESKREIIARVAKASVPEPTDDDVRALPCLGIRPAAGTLRWYLDHTACALKG